MPALCRRERIVALSRTRAAVAVGGLAAFVALLTVAVVQVGAAAPIGEFLAGDSPGANAALGIATGVPIALGALALAWHRRGRAATRELQRLARTDPLTGVPNRGELPKALARAVSSTRDGLHHAAVLFCDLDRFKQVNDGYGHEVGDELMVAVARRMQEAAGRTAVVVRNGGDEFVVVAGRLDSTADAEAMAHRLVEAIEAPFELGADTVRISVSVGVAVTDRCGAGAEDLVADADVAMYAAKADGPGSVRAFEPAMRARLSRATAAPHLRGALDHHELELRFAPVHALGDGALVALRGGLWWDGPMRNPVSGRELESALDDTGLIVEAGDVAIQEACAALQGWARDAALVDLQVVLPVSPRQLAQARFRDRVALEVGAYGVKAGQLCLVVDGGGLYDGITDAWAMLRHIRALGVPVALQGFGAATSSIADLRAARLDQLWLHPELIAGLVPGSEDAAIVEHVIGLAHRLGTVVVADGVTGAAQHQMLRTLGCDRAAGPFFGSGLDATDVAAILASRPTFTPSVALPRLRAV